MEVSKITSTFNKIMKIFALNRVVEGEINTIENNKTYGFSLVIILILSAYFDVVGRIKYRYGNAYIEDVVTNFIGILWTTIPAVLSVLVSITENESNIITYYKNFESVDSALNINNDCNYKEEKKIANFHLAIFFIFLIITFLFDFLAYWALDCSLFIIVILFYPKYPYCFGILIVYESILKFCCLERRVKLLVIYFKECSEALLMKKESDCAFLELKLLKEVNQENRNFGNFLKCYLKLCEQCNLISKSHGFQLLLQFLAMFIRMLEMYTVILINSTKKESSSNGLEEKWVIADCAVRLCYDSVILVFMVRKAQIIQNYSDHFVFLLDKTYAEAYDSKSSTTESLNLLRHISVVINRHPLRFTAYDFFPIGFNVLPAMFASFISYVVIITQFYYTP